MVAGRGAYLRYLSGTQSQSHLIALELVMAGLGAIGAKLSYGASSASRSSSSAHADDPVITESRDLARLCLNAACGGYWMPRLKRGMTTREVGEESLSWRAWNAAPGLPEQSGLRAALSGPIAQVRYCRPA